MKVKSIINFAMAGMLLIFSAALLAAQQTQAPDQPVYMDYQGGKVTIYPPQPEALQDNTLTALSAVSITSSGETPPKFGAVLFNAQIKTDPSTKTYRVQSVKVVTVRFPNFTAAEQKELSSAIESELPKQNAGGSYDDLLSKLDAAKQEVQLSSEFQTTPPKIIFVPHPAVLVFIDGKPNLQAIEGSPNLMRVVNTPMLLIFNKKDNKFYLSSGNIWYSTNDVLKGQWQIENNPQAEIKTIVTKDGKQVETKMPSTQMPEIIVATSPTELITSDGQPQYSTIKDTSLLYMSNTENDVIFDLSSQQYFVLLSGRWFASNSLNGQWNFVSPDKLPADFAKIPANSDKGNVLVNVPNTEQAQNALLDSQVPQIKQVKRSEAKLTVQYDGTPRFVRIKGTSIKYAENSSVPVLLIGNRYYACDNAIWYVAATPFGPWVVTDAVPYEVKKIPPSCPYYYVKYVNVYYYTPYEIYFGYTPGYCGWYPYYGTVVYGTGFFYPPWYGYYYYPRFSTYCFGVHYNPFFGWSFGSAWGNVFLSIGFGWNTSFGGNFGWFGYGPGWYHPLWYSPGWGYGYNYKWYNKYWYGQRFNMINRINIGNQINIANRRFNVNNTIANFNRGSPMSINKSRQFSNMSRSFNKGFMPGKTTFREGTMLPGRTIFPSGIPGRTIMPSGAAIHQGLSGLKAGGGEFKGGAFKGGAIGGEFKGLQRRGGVTEGMGQFQDQLRGKATEGFRGTTELKAPTGLRGSTELRGTTGFKAPTRLRTPAEFTGPGVISRGTIHESITAPRTYTPRITAPRHVAPSISSTPHGPSGFQKGGTFHSPSGGFPSGGTFHGHSGGGHSGGSSAFRGAGGGGVHSRKNFDQGSASLNEDNGTDKH